MVLAADQRARGVTAGTDRGPAVTLGRAARAVVEAKSLAGLLQLQAQLCRAAGAAAWRDGGVCAGDVTGWAEAAERAVGRAGGDVGEAECAAGVAVAAVLDDRHAVAVLLRETDPAVRMLAAERLTLTAGLWREMALRGEAADATAARDRLGRVAAALAAFDGEAAELAVCQHLARTLGATRVSLGEVGRRGVRVLAASDAAEVRPGRAIEALRAVMEECADQRREVSHPNGGDAMARAAAELARDLGPRCVASFPLLCGDRPAAVLTIERPADAPLTAGEAQELRVVAQLLRPALTARSAARHWLSPRAKQLAAGLAAKVVGPTHTAAKLALLAFAAAVGLACVVPGEVTAGGSFVAESPGRRVVAAPFEGVLRAAHAEPGDAVAAGAALAELDATDLLLALSAARAQERSERAKAEAARAAGDPTAAELAGLEAEALAARAALLAGQIDDAAVVAPAAGVVLAGDWSGRLNTPVERGQTLFEVGPAQARRAVVLIDERDAGGLAAGQRVALRPASAPGSPVAAVIVRVSPAVEDVDGRRVVRLAADLDTPLRHGAEGAASVATGRAPLAIVWLRPAWRAAGDLLGG